jgi:hypothetical protein
MRPILAISRRAIDAMKAAFDRTIEQVSQAVSASRIVPHPPQRVSESRTAAGVLPSLPAGRQDTSNDELQLKHICEAIGLDPSQLTEKPALRDDLGTDPRSFPNPANGRDPFSLQEPAFHVGAGQSFGVAVESFLHDESRSTALDPGDIADLLASLKVRLLKIRLAPDDMAEAEAEIETAIAQLLSPRPKPQIVGLSLHTLIAILDQAGAAALTDDIETSLIRLRVFLSQWNV